MGSFKKTVFLLLVSGFISWSTPAQPALPEQKITITNFTVYEKGTKRLINWATDGKVTTNYWQVQKSDDGSHFSTIALVLGPDPGEPGDRYQTVDKITVGAFARPYYRLCHIDQNGNEQLSEIIQPAK